jgi:cell wall-associated NlpC family hydrolase
MTYGICHLSVVPLRAEAKDQAELISQLLFGDLVEILHVKDNWTKVKCLFDDYSGWMDTKQISVLSQIEFDQIQASEKVYAKNHFTKVELHGSEYTVPFGSTFYKDTSAFTVPTPESEPSSFNSISSAAKSYLNAPYLWGGKTYYVIDCSGFTQTVYKVFGISLKRDASQQAEQGRLIPFEEIQENDLAFFVNTKGRVIHVGIVLEDLSIIHASGKVRIDSLNRDGIYNPELKKQTHTLHSIRRF